MGSAENSRKTGVKLGGIAMENCMDMVFRENTKETKLPRRELTTKATTTSTSRKVMSLKAL